MTLPMSPDWTDCIVSCSKTVFKMTRHNCTRIHLQPMIARKHGWNAWIIACAWLSFVHHWVWYALARSRIPLGVWYPDSVLHILCLGVILVIRITQLVVDPVK